MPCCHAHVQAFISYVFPDKLYCLNPGSSCPGAQVEELVFLQMSHRSHGQALWADRQVDRPLTLDPSTDCFLSPLFSWGPCSWPLKLLRLLWPSPPPVWAQVLLRPPSRVLSTPECHEVRGCTRYRLSRGRGLLGEQAWACLHAGGCCCTIRRCTCYHAVNFLSSQACSAVPSDFTDKGQHQRQEDYESQDSDIGATHQNEAFLSTGSYVTELHTKEAGPGWHVKECILFADGKWEALEVWSRGNGMRTYQYMQGEKTDHTWKEKASMRIDILSKRRRCMIIWA